MVDTISAEPPVMQQPGASSGSAETEKSAEECGGSPLPTALWKLANIGHVDIPEAVDMATTQPGNVVMAEILGLEVGNESSNFSPRELKVPMSRAVCYGIITHCFEHYRYESCIGCVIQAPAQNSHDCILWTKRYLCRKLSWLCGQISFKNVLHICLFVAYSFYCLLIIKETVDQILQIVTEVGRAENSLKEINKILRPCDKPILEHVFKVIKNRSYKAFLTTFNSPSEQ
ncbi:hypothetical protein JD844_027788 [Phrynosoma platyrhinos]|uniref:Uncharacterized protein n=1 Tax=Phrynosoma platyrhinos TaxID=52577 RepID=A0ABQ7SGT3_PHRPL|nr:hypothetical protein JD844_027788 [Phrynosoma platyrhinos]